MDPYHTPEKPPVDSSCMRKVGCATAGALVAVAAWRRQRRCDAFPLVYAQQTMRNQAICSLMSAVLLRKVNEQYSGDEPRCCRNKTRQVREKTSIQQNSKRRAEDGPLTWHIPGNDEVAEFPSGSISSPTLLVVHNVIDGSLVNAICDGAAQSGCVVAELLLHSGVKTSRTAIR